MTAESTSAPAGRRAPPAGLVLPTGERLDSGGLRPLAASAPCFELFDGALVTTSPQTSFHSRVMRRLANVIELASPEPLRRETDMSVHLGKRQRPEADIRALDALAAPSAPRTDPRKSHSP